MAMSMKIKHMVVEILDYTPMHLHLSGMLWSLNGRQVNLMHKDFFLPIVYIYPKKKNQNIMVMLKKSSQDISSHKSASHGKNDALCMQQRQILNYICTDRDFKKTKTKKCFVYGSLIQLPSDSQLSFFSPSKLKYFKKNAVVSNMESTEKLNLEENVSIVTKNL